MEREMCPGCVPGGTPHYAGAACVQRLLAALKLSEQRLAVVESTHEVSVFNHNQIYEAYKRFFFALRELCELKTIHEAQGDTPEYRRRKASAWAAAFALFPESIKISSEAMGDDLGPAGGSRAPGNSPDEAATTASSNTGTELRERAEGTPTAIETSRPGDKSPWGSHSGSELPPDGGAASEEPASVAGSVTTFDCPACRVLYGPPWIAHNGVCSRCRLAKLEQACVELSEALNFYADEQGRWLARELKATGRELASRFDEAKGESVPVPIEPGQVLGVQWVPRGSLQFDRGKRARSALERARALLRAPS